MICISINTFAQGNLNITLLPKTYVGNYNISCHGATNGEITIQISGGNAPYNILWNNAYNIKLGLDPNSNTDVKQFFLNNEARRFFSNKLRYAQARWGYSPAIGIWQLTSEIDQYGGLGGSDASNNNLVGSRYASTSAVFSADHVAATETWNIVMADFLSNLYPKHLVTTSYIRNPFINNTGINLGACIDKSYLLSEKLDLIALNTYNYEGDEFYDRGRFQITHDVIFDEDNDHCNSENQGYFVDKPLFFTESGNSKNTCDACTDISMHNTSWAALCSGQMGVPLQWHAHDAWNQTGKTDIEDFYSNFNALASFIDGLDFETHRYKPSVQNEDELIFDKGNTQSGGNSINMDLEIFVMQNDNSGINQKSDRGFGWVHHKKGTWKASSKGLNNGSCQSSLLTGADLPQNITAATYQYNLNGFKFGDYLIEAYDTRNGNLIFSSSANNAIHADLFNTLKLGVPLVNLFHDTQNPMYDYAFKFWHSSVNGNDLRLANKDNSDSTKTISLPGDNDEFKKHFLVSIGPNPTHKDLNVIALGSQISEVKVNETTGKLMYEEKLQNTNNWLLNLENYANGFYFVTVKSQDGIVKIFKIIKQ